MFTPEPWHYYLRSRGSSRNDGGGEIRPFLSSSPRGVSLRARGVIFHFSVYISPRLSPCLRAFRHHWQIASQMVGSEPHFFQCAVASIKSLVRRNESTSKSLYRIWVPGIFEPGTWHSVIYPLQYLIIILVPYLMAFLALEPCSSNT